MNEGSTRTRTADSARPAPNGSEADDPRILLALEEYLAAVEAGQPPDRRAFLARHREVARALADCLDGLELVRSAARNLHPSTCGATADLVPTPPGPEPEPAPDILGDFHLVRLVGRGGMGVVYEARQDSLARRVALKVLPSAAALDPRQLQRFRVEAQAAAQLHHPHIVPVYAVGCERGVHYYAMQFIDGPTLADLIRDLRLARDPDAVAEAAAPPPSHSGSRPGGRGAHRAVARLGVQAAAALDHAHALGIVHRDIKPANLMLDALGNLWITDFGLARWPSELGLTMTGDVLGTLRYMSPEQAQASRAVVDHRTDVYALGATLYELLTLRPVFDGRDRQDLLRQIAQDEPRRPRRIDPTIPRELETVILKALSKEPADRYPTALELAEDLRRFLDDQPVRARRPSLPDRASRWARRHRAWVASALVLLALVSGGLGASTWIISQERDQARAHRDRAQRKASQAKRFVDSLYAQAVGDLPAPSPERASLQRSMLETTLGYYQEFSLDDSPDPDARLDAALACQRIGEIQWRLGRLSHVEEAYRRGIALLQPAAEASGVATARSREELATLHDHLGRFLHAISQDGAAEAAHRRAIGLQSALVNEFPGGPRWRLLLASYQVDLGDLLATSGRAAEAVPVLKTARALLSRPGGPDLIDGEIVPALSSVIDSRLSEASGQPDRAIAACRRALELYQACMDGPRNRAENRNRLAQAYFRLSWLLIVADPSAESDGEAVELAERAVAMEPFNAAYHNQQARVLMGAGRWAEAERSFRRVLELMPDSPDARNSLAWFLSTCPELPRRRPDEALRLAREAVDGAPGVGIYHNTLGVAFYRAGRLDEAAAELGRSMALRDGGDSYDWFFLAMIRHRQGDHDGARHWWFEGVRWMNRNRPRLHELHQLRIEAEALLGLHRPDPALSACPTPVPAAGGSA